ncbi:MAG: sensor histidine kinase, partial [Acidobacteria bacterium]
GLGLSIVYQIVKDHGGSINVRSIEGKGTTVNLEFPPINYLTLTRMREKLNQKTS